MTLQQCTMWGRDPEFADSWIPVIPRAFFSEPLSKAATQYEPLKPNERWITLHPHGDDSKGVPVKIKVAPDGTGHILHGPAAVRGMRLTKLASPEELKARQKERAAKKREKRREEQRAKKVKEAEDQKKRAEDPEYNKKRTAEEVEEQKAAAAKRERTEKLEGEMRQVHEELLKLAHAITGDDAYKSEIAESVNDPLKADAYKSKAIAEAGDDTHAHAAATKIASENTQRISKALDSLSKGLVKSLVRDGKLREAVLDEQMEVEAPKENPEKGGQYQSKTLEQAEAQGYTEEDAKQESGQVFEQRMRALTSQGAGEKAAKIRKGKKRQEKIGEEKERLTSEAKEGDALQKVEPKKEASVKEIEEHAGQVRKFLKLHSQLEELKKEKRKLAINKDPQATDEEKALVDMADRTPTGADVGLSVHEVDREFTAKLEQEIKDAESADLLRSFLDMAYQGEREEGASEPTQKEGKSIRAQIQGDVSLGAQGHFTNIALASLGHEGIDRQVIDALGVEAGAALMAHAIRRDHDDIEGLKAGLEKVHDELTMTELTEAMEIAEEAREDAGEIEIPSVGSGTDIAVVKDLQLRRKSALKRAQTALGNALGKVEAGAALNMALKSDTTKELRVRFGQVKTEQIALQLRALGLGDSDYRLERGAHDNRLSAYITPAGQDKLTQSISPEERARQQEIADIKAGKYDEENYLPTGFVARQKSDLHSNPALPASLVVDANWQNGAEHLVHETAASMAALGYKPSEILEHFNGSLRQECPSAELETYDQNVEELIPHLEHEEVEGENGNTYTKTTVKDMDNNEELKARLQELADNWLAENHPEETSFHNQTLKDDKHTREALFRAISEKPALQVAFTDPADIGADSEGRQKAKALRSYFFDELFSSKQYSMKPADFDARAKKEQKKALERIGEEPKKWLEAGDKLTGSLFDDLEAKDEDVTISSPNGVSDPRFVAVLRTHYGLLPEHYEQSEDGSKIILNEAGKDALRLPARPPRANEKLKEQEKREEEERNEDENSEDKPKKQGSEKGSQEEYNPELVNIDSGALNPDWVEHHKNIARIKNDNPTLSDLWDGFKDTMRGTKNAYAAIQEMMQGELLHSFVEHHAALTGRQMRVSKETTKHWERRLSSMNPEAAQRIRERDQQMMDEVRERDSTGQYADMGGAGGLFGAMEARRQTEEQRRHASANLFGLEGTGKTAGEVTASRPDDLQVGEHERISLGRAAEGQIARILGSAPFGVSPTSGKNPLIHDLTWGKDTEHVGKQRAVKMLLKTGRLLGFFGAGSGKTATMLGAFTQAHEEGKAKKGLFVVPSIVRNQFGEEAARFTEPGRYQWHAGDAKYDERKQHYSGDTHMVVVTHQTFRDDMLKMMGEHHQVEEGGEAEWFSNLSRPERAAAYKEAMEAHGVPLDMISVDEAHDFLNRAGKAESSMSQVLEAALDNHKFKSLWTGSPVKNDLSEVHDWLSKVDPERFSDRDEFIRRYGVKSTANSEALRRLVEQYGMVDSVKPDVKRKVVWGHQSGDTHQPLPLTDKQHEAIKQVEQAAARGREAKKRGTVDIEAMKVLSPNSFPEEEGERHHEIAGQLQEALGTLKHAALGRVVNEFEPEHNAKIQHVMQLADERKGKGGVVFAHNKRSIRLLREQLEGKGHKVGVIDGSTTTSGKARIRQDFDAGKIDIVLCSDAGATGANFQKRGEWLVNYDLPDTQKTLEQRNARIDRLGQEKAIELHHLATNSRFDRINIDRLRRKEELGSILQGAFKNMDDYGVGALLRRAHEERKNNTPMQA